MDLITGALLLAGAFNLLLAGIILFHAPHTRANVSYAVLVLCLLAWIGAIVALRLAASPPILFTALAASYTSGLGIALSFWYFAAFFTGRRLHALTQVAVISGALLVSWQVWMSPHFIEAISGSPGTLSLHIGRYGWVFFAYFAVVMADAFRSLGLRYRASNGDRRAQLSAILLGTLGTTALGATFNVVLVQAGDASYIGWGPVSTILMVAFIAYAIVRHHLMSIHLVTAELFTFGLILSLVLNFMVSPNGVSRLMEAVTLQLAIGFGTYVIRAALRDARERDPERGDTSDRSSRKQRDRSLNEA